MITIEMRQGNGYRCRLMRIEGTIIEEYYSEDDALQGAVWYFRRSKVDWDFYIEKIKGAKDNEALLAKINKAFEHIKAVQNLQKNIKVLTEKIQTSQRFLDTAVEEIVLHKKNVSAATAELAILNENF